MKISNYSGIDLKLYVGNSESEEPDATLELKNEDSKNVPLFAFETILIKKIGE